MAQTDDDNQIYETVLKEFDDGNLKKGLWARLFSEADGDHNKAKARYIKIRVEELLNIKLKAKQNNSDAIFDDINRINPPKFGYIGFFSNGLAPFSKFETEYDQKKLYGFIDEKGNIRIDAKFSTAWAFDKFGLSLVSVGFNGFIGSNYINNARYGIIDKEGNWVLPAEYYYASQDEEFYYLSKGLNKDQGASEEFKFSKHNRYLSQIYKTAMFGYFFGANSLIPRKFFEWDSKWFFDKKNIDKFGYVDRSGKWLIKAEYDEALHFSEGRAFVGIGQEKNRKFLMIDEGGKKVGNFLFSDIEWGYFDYDEFARVSCDFGEHKSYFHINKNGESIYKNKFKKILEINKYGFFTASLGKLYQDPLCGVCDLSGNFVLEPKYTAAFDIAGRYFSIQENGKFGLIDRRGKLLLPHKYDNIFQIGENHIGVYNENEDCKTRPTVGSVDIIFMDTL